MDFKERISAVINFSELSLSEFADEIEVQRSSISHVTSGRNKPSLDFIVKIKTRFPEIQWDWLIEGKGEMLKKAENPEKNVDSSPKTKTTSLPDLFSLINDEAFGVTESEDTIAPKDVSEFDIPQPMSSQKKISDSQRLELKPQKDHPQNIQNQDVKLKRIVFFYDNGKFETFEP